MAPGALESLVAQLNAQAQARGEQAFEFKTIPQGAATGVWAGVVAPVEDVAARFCEDCHVADISDAGAEVRSGVRSYALDGEHAKALWAKSEAMVGERF